MYHAQKDSVKISRSSIAIFEFFQFNKSKTGKRILVVIISVGKGRRLYFCSTLKHFIELKTLYSPSKFYKRNGNAWIHRRIIAYNE